MTAASGVLAPSTEKSERYLWHWRFLIGINVIVSLAEAIYIASEPPNPLAYTHLLVDYNFGFIRRGLIGEIVSLFLNRISPFDFFVLGGIVVLVTAVLYLKLFQRTFGFTYKTMPLFVFVIGSPLFLKHFIKAVGYFDIFGFLFAVILLLVRPQRFGYVLLAFFACLTLLLIHHIHILLYIPTIGAIVVIKYFFPVRRSSREMIGAVICLCLTFICSVCVQHFGSMSVSKDVFRAYLESKVAVDSPERAAQFYFIWYRTIADEIQTTWLRIPERLIDIPVYALLAFLHLPLLKYFRLIFMSIADERKKRIFFAMLAFITCGYVVIFGLVFDYARWVCSYFTCILLLAHAVREMSDVRVEETIPTDDRLVYTSAAVLSFIPKIGIISPWR